jgi:DNA-binding MarR family transcriptional regulator
LETLVLLLARLGALNDVLIAEVCAREGVTAAELRTLGVLRRTGGEASPSVIARMIVQTSGGLTATLKRLAGRGLVTRRADTTDGRGRLVVLTPAGEAVHDRMVAALLARYERVFAGVDVDAALVTVRSLVEPLEEATRAASSAAWSSDAATAPA